MSCSLSKGENGSLWFFKDHWERGELRSNLIWSLYEKPVSFGDGSPGFSRWADVSFDSPVVYLGQYQTNEEGAQLFYKVLTKALDSDDVKIGWIHKENARFLYRIDDFPEFFI